MLVLVLLWSSIQPVLFGRSKRCHNWFVCGLSLEVRTPVQWKMRFVEFAWNSCSLGLFEPSYAELDGQKTKRMDGQKTKRRFNLNFVAQLRGMHLLEVLLASGVTMLAVTFFKVQRSFMLSTCQCHATVIDKDQTWKTCRTLAVAKSSQDCIRFGGNSYCQVYSSWDIKCSISCFGS